MLARIKINDTVMIISGKDKGKTGTVIDISAKKGKVMVKGIAVVTRHTKPKRQGETGGIKKLEGYIDLSKVMPICPETKKPARVGSKTLENGEKVRAFRTAKQ
jgi:large subunit ribosomal protein L24